MEATRRLLEADRVAVLDVLTGNDELEVRTASPPLPEQMMVASGSGSFAGYVALARKVVVVDDTRADARFEATPIWPGLPANSAIGAPIFGPAGIRAVLTAESSTYGRFERSADHFVQGIANIIGTVLLS